MNAFQQTPQNYFFGENASFNIQIMFVSDVRWSEQFRETSKKDRKKKRRMNERMIERTNERMK
jgi:hypothetical protein